MGFGGKMKNLFLVLALIFSMGSTAMALDGSPALLGAITLCQAPNNPLHNGLHKLGGNVFDNVTQTVENVDGNEVIHVSATAVASPHSNNLAIMAADKIVGTIKLKIYYKHDDLRDRPLVCELEARPN
jgi:hypothetical protein